MANPVTQIILTAVDRTRAAFASVKSGFASIGARADALSAQIGLIFTGLSVVGFVGAFRRVANEMDEVAKGAQKAGTSVENLSALNFAADQSGVKDMTKSLIALSDSLGKAKDGAGPAFEAFRALAIDPAQFTDSSDALDAIADRFAALPDGIYKTSLAVDLFGKRIGPNLIPLLNEGRAGIQALKDEAAALGVVFDTEAAAAAERFNDNLDKLANAGKGLAVAVATDILPGLTQVTDAMTKAAKDGGLLKAAWVGLGGLGAALFTDDLLTNSQKLAKAQEQLNDALDGGFAREHKWVRQLETNIVVLKNLVAEEERASEAKKKSAASARAAADVNARAMESRKEEIESFKKSVDEQVKDAERLQAALQTAFSASIKSEESYLRQAKKLRAEASGGGTTSTDPESQAKATLDATIAAMKLQREAGTASLETVQDQAEALQALAQQLDDQALKSDLIRQAKLAEAAALDKAAADEKVRYTQLGEIQDEQARKTQNMKDALAGVGKEVSVDLKPGVGIQQVKKDLTDIKNLLDAIGNRPLSVGVSASGTAAVAAALKTEALKYGNRQ